MEDGWTDIVPVKIDRTWDGRTMDQGHGKGQGRKITEHPNQYHPNFKVILNCFVFVLVTYILNIYYCAARKIKHSALYI